MKPFLLRQFAGFLLRAKSFWRERDFAPKRFLLLKLKQKNCFITHYFSFTLGLFVKHMSFPRLPSCMGGVKWRRSFGGANFFRVRREGAEAEGKWGTKRKEVLMERKGEKGKVKPQPPNVGSLC